MKSAKVRVAGIERDGDERAERAAAADALDSVARELATIRRDVRRGSSASQALLALRRKLRETALESDARLGLLDMIEMELDEWRRAIDEGDIAAALRYAYYARSRIKSWRGAGPTHDEDRAVDELLSRMGESA